MTGQKKAARRRVEKGTPLYEWRMGLGITQEDAAKALGVSSRTYHRYEALANLPRTLELAWKSVKNGLK